MKGLKRDRRPADDPQAPRRWRPLRKSVAYMTRRVELSQASNQRYLEAQGTLPADTPLKRLADKVCQPVVAGRRRLRALNPLSAQDAQPFAIVSRGEYLIAGFRNRDIRQALHGDEADEVKRRQAVAVTRQLTLLRAHGLIKKVPRTHRYLLSSEGTAAISAFLAARNATLEQLTPAA